MNSASSRPPHFALPPLPDLRSLKVFGRKICYYDVGTGPPLVLVHGLGADADVWAFCLGALSTSHRVIALDLLGFGRSDKPLINYQVAVFVEVLRGFLDALGIERASLLGNSLGGCIVATFTLEFPGVVDKLILNDAVGIRAGAIEFPIDLSISTHAHMREVLEFMFHDKQRVTDDLVDLTYQLHLERNDGYTIRSVLASNRDGRDFLDDRLAELKLFPPCFSGVSMTPLRRCRWRKTSTGSSPAPGWTLSPSVATFRHWRSRTSSCAACWRFWGKGIA